MKRVLTILIIIYSGVLCYSQINNAELVLQETNISIREGKLIKDLKYEIKINNRGGEKLTKVTIPYSKLVKVSKIEAYIKDNNGQIVRKLQKNDITDKSAISDYSLYEDDYIKEFTLKHNSYPYSICYSYEAQQAEFLQIDYWVPVLDWKTPTISAILTVEVPKDYRISYRNRLTDSFKCDSSGLTVKYTWNASYKDLIEPQIFCPDILRFVPEVTVVPVNFKYEIPGSFSSWEKFGEWHDNLLKGLSDLPQAEKNSILYMVDTIKNQKDKIKLLYYYLQDHTRYINITIETGGMKPYPASYVSENKYGDCKALSNYFKAMLECAGIKSFYTKVFAGDQITDIDKSFPSQQFNHIILCVPQDMDTIWLDCTSDMAFDYLGTFTQARDVFLVDGTNSHFSRTPSLTTADVKETRKATFRQDADNQVVADFSDSYGGDMYESFFGLFSQVNENDRFEIFRNHIAKNGLELIGLKMNLPPRDSAIVRMTYTASSNRSYKNYGNDMIIEVLPFSLPRFEDPAKRKLPVDIDYPVSREDNLIYEIPDGYTVTAKLSDQNIESEYGRYKCVSVLKDNRIYVTKSFVLFPGKYSLDKYKGFYDFLAKVIDIEINNMIVTNKKF